VIIILSFLFLHYLYNTAFVSIFNKEIDDDDDDDDDDAVGYKLLQVQIRIEFLKSYPIL